LTLGADLATVIRFSVIRGKHALAQKAVDLFDYFAKLSLLRVIGTRYQHGLSVLFARVFYPATANTAAKTDALKVFYSFAQCQLSPTPNGQRFPLKKNCVFGLFLWVTQIQLRKKVRHRTGAVKRGRKLLQLLLGGWFSCFFHMPTPQR
jgi:hypothetical protein